METMTYDKLSSLAPDFRRLDCEVAIRFGWVPMISEEANVPRSEWWQQDEWLSPNRAGMIVGRDHEAYGVPPTSTDISRAWEVVRWVCERWAHVPRSCFWRELQKCASFSEDKTTFPAYPEVFQALIGCLPESICKAFIAASEWYEKQGINPLLPPPLATTFASEVEKTITTEKVVDDCGNETEVKRLHAKPTSAPWVNNTPKR